MTFDWNKILESKRAFRQRMAARPIEEKLAMLDSLRASAIAICESRRAAETSNRAQPKQPG
jgi:hypothetical protein